MGLFSITAQTRFFASIGAIHSAKKFIMYSFKHKTLDDFNLCIVERNDDTRIDVFVDDIYIFTAFKDEFSISRLENFDIVNLYRIEKLDVSIHEVCALLKAINGDFQVLTTSDFRGYVTDYGTVSDCIEFIFKVCPNFLRK